MWWLSAALAGSPPATVTFEQVQPTAPATPEPATTEPLSEARVRALLERIDPLPEPTRTASKLPPHLARPRPTVEAPPPPEDRPEPPASAGPATVVMHQPEGDVKVARRIVATFNEPMVAVSSHAVTSETVPLVLDPPLQGTWRWLGTQTVVFEAGDRLPMAMDVHVSTRPDLHSAQGNLVEPLDWSFTTPAPRMLQARIVSPESARPQLTLSFDQPVEPSDVAAGLAVEGVNPVLVTTEASRAITFTIEGPVYGERSLSLAPGVRGTEGPRVSREASVQRVEGIPLLETQQPRCGGLCQAVVIPTSTPIDPDQPLERWVRVRPRVRGLEVSTAKGQLHLTGSFEHDQAYRIHLDRQIRDIHGQTLQEDHAYTFAKPAPPARLGLSLPTRAVLDPNLPPTLEVYSTGLDTFDLQVRRVTPGDLLAFIEADRDLHRPELGELLLDTVVPVTQGGSIQATEVDLAPFLDQGLGMLLVAVGNNDVGKSGLYDHTFVQSTRLGLRATWHVERRRYAISVTDLGTGRPLAGVQVGSPGAEQVATTDEDGFAFVDGGDLLEARLGRDHAATTSWNADDLPSRHGPDAWFVFDDRGLYRPGETVQVRGLLRTRDEQGLLQPFAAADAITWRVDGGSTLSASGSAPLTDHGGFELAVELPEDTATNLALTLTAGDAQHRKTIFVYPYRRRSFDVSLDADTTPWVHGEARTLTARAHYLTGLAVTGSIEWSARTRPVSIAIPNHDAYTFGARSWGSPTPETNQGQRRLERGSQTIRVNVTPEPQAPVEVTVDARITDVDQQAQTASWRSILHPARVYAGLRPHQRLFSGETIGVDVIAADPEGHRERRTVTLTARPHTWAWEPTQGWFSEGGDTSTCTVTTGAEPVFCALSARVSGRYEVSATVIDEEGRLSETTTYVWVSNDTAAEDHASEGHASVTPDRSVYEAGDPVTLLIESPFAPAWATVLVAAEPHLIRERVHLTRRNHELQITLPDAFTTPMVDVRVHLDGSRPTADGGRRAAFASAHTRLRVDPAERRLEVQVEPVPQALAPAARGHVAARVTAGGRPVKDVAVTLWAVDEGVPMAQHSPDPVIGMYTSHRLWDGWNLGRREGIREGLERRTPQQAIVPRRLGRGMSAGVSAGATVDRSSPEPGPAPTLSSEPTPQQPIQVRQQFAGLAFWRGELITDAEGRVQADFTLPDSVTRYKVMAVAADRKDRFGTGEATLTATVPLAIHPTPPRFLNVGDRALLSVTVENTSDEAQVVDLAARASNARFLSALAQPGEPYQVGSATTGRRFGVGPGARIEVLLPMATDLAGEATFQLVASSGTYADATVVEIPVYTPTTSEDFATYGSLKAATVRLPIRAPGEVWARYGGLEVALSSSLFPAVGRRVESILSSPPISTHQVATRVLTLLALRDRLETLDQPGLPSPGEAAEQLRADLDWLATHQSHDGSFPYWPGHHLQDIGGSLWAAEAVVRARQASIEVPPDLLEHSTRFLERLLNHGSDPKTRRVRVQAHAVSLLTRLGQPRSNAVARLTNGADPERLAHLLPHLSVEASEEPLASLLAATELESGTARIVTEKAETPEGYVLKTSTRTEALALDALLQVAPEHPVVPALARHLHEQLQGRVSRIELAVGLLALDRYSKRFEERDAVEARTWLGPTYLGSRATPAVIDIPMGELSERPSTDLTLQARGDGRLYYRAALTSFPRSQLLPAASHGLWVERFLHAVEDPSDVQLLDGVWHVRRGADVRLVTQLFTAVGRPHVDLDVPFAAGMELLSPMDLGRVREQWRQTASDAFWIDHQQLFDDRAVAHSLEVRPGLHTYTVTLRATLPGSFVLPPAKASVQERPEVHGRSASLRVNIH